MFLQYKKVSSASGLNKRVISPMRFGWSLSVRGWGLALFSCWGSHNLVVLQDTVCKLKRKMYPTYNI
jgi:hypothetical protein